MIASTPADDPATSPLRLDEIVDTDAWFLNRCGSPVSAEIAARACLDLRETNCALIMRPRPLLKSCGTKRPNSRRMPSMSTTLAPMTTDRLIIFAAEPCPERTGLCVVAGSRDPASVQGWRSDRFRFRLSRCGTVSNRPGSISMAQMSIQRGLAIRSPGTSATAISRCPSFRGG